MSKKVAQVVHLLQTWMHGCTFSQNGASNFFSRPKASQSVEVCLEVQWSEVKAGLVKRCSDEGGNGQQAMMLLMSFNGMRRSTRPSDAQGSGKDGGFTSRLEVPEVKKLSTYKENQHPKNCCQDCWVKRMRQIENCQWQASDFGEKRHCQVLQFFQALRSHLSQWAKVVVNSPKHRPITNQR